MKGKMTHLVLILLLSALAISGCTSASSAGMPTPAGRSSRPSDPVGARDAVLAYLGENYADSAPAAGLAWVEAHTKPEGMVGGESYEYTAGDWLISVSYPVVAPENVVYTIAVTNQTIGFRWEGQVNAQGQVTETSFAGRSSRPSDPVGARDAVLAYLAENYADSVPAAGLAWAETHTKPEGMVGGESYEYSAGDWLIAVSYPVVAPENVVYTMVVTNQATGFRWEGQVDAQGQVAETSFAGQSPRPSDPVGARDAVLAHLADNYGGEAPAAKLAWVETHTKPEGVVGGESYEYTAGDWLIAVSYPVVAPENVVYTIAVINQATGFRWEGQVDAQGQVTETSAGTKLTSDGWRIYRNETLGYSFQYPAEAEIITADDPLQSLTVSGPGMRDETWVISHPSDRQEYRPPEGVDLAQWLTDRNLVGEKRLPDLQIAGTTAIHFRHERSPQSYADDRYFFARGGQLYMVLIGHGDVEDWELNNRFLQSFQFGGAASDTSALTAIPTPLPIIASDYQGFWTYTHPEYNFSIMLPEDWIVEEITTNDPLMNGHMLRLYPRLQGQGVEGLLVRMTFRRVGEEALLWPTGVGAGEFVSQGTLDVAGQPARRIYFVCPTGQIQSIWYQGGENQPNIQRGDLEFGFILSLTGFYCEGDHSLGGKVQRVGEMIIASLKVP